MKNLRRMIALLLTICALAPPLGASAASGAEFSDVPASHWAYEGVSRASSLGLINGVGNGVFGLGREVTRAEYATMLCRLMGWTMLSPEKGSFEDNQNKNAWYYSAIETAYANGALLKLGAGCGPKEAITREEMTAMTVRALGYSYTLWAGTVQDDCPFADVTTNRGYIAIAYRMGLVGGTGAGKFSPRATCKREQAAAVLLRVYDRLNGGLSGRTVVYQRGKETPGTAVYAEALIGTEGSVPMSPRASFESVYAAAVEAGEGGAVALHTAPFAQFVKNGVVDGGVTLTEAELEAFLADEATVVKRSERYGSSYLIRTGRDGLATVVWYETEEDLDAKVRLCRLMGVGAVYFAE